MNRTPFLFDSGWSLLCHDAAKKGGASHENVSHGILNTICSPSFPLSFPLSLSTVCTSPPSTPRPSFSSQLIPTLKLTAFPGSSIRPHSRFFCPCPTRLPCLGRPRPCLLLLLIFLVPPWVSGERGLCPPFIFLALCTQIRSGPCYLVGTGGCEGCYIWGLGFLGSAAGSR